MGVENNKALGSNLSFYYDNEFTHTIRNLNRLSQKIHMMAQENNPNSFFYLADIKILRIV